jgi:hypothetical protein
MIRTLTTLTTAVALALSASLIAPLGSPKGSLVALIVYNGHAGLGSN